MDLFEKLFSGRMVVQRSSKADTTSIGCKPLQTNGILFWNTTILYPIMEKIAVMAKGQLLNVSYATWNQLRDTALPPCKDFKCCFKV